MKKKPVKRKASRVRHRSPVPRPGGPMEKKGYHRPASRKAVRRAVEDSAAAPPLRPIEPEEIEQVTWDAEEEE